MSGKLVNLSAGEVLNILKAHGKKRDVVFNLWQHKTIPNRWQFSAADKDFPDTPIAAAYPVTLPKGLKSELDRRRIKQIAAHFGVPPENFRK